MRRQEDKEVESRRRKESRAATVSVRLSAANQIPNPPGLRQGGKVSITMFYLLLALINNQKVLSIFFQQERLLHYLKGIETTSNTQIWLRLKLQSTFSTSKLLLLARVLLLPLSYLLLRSKNKRANTYYQEDNSTFARAPSLATLQTVPLVHQTGKTRSTGGAFRSLSSRNNE